MLRATVFVCLLSLSLVGCDDDRTSRDAGSFDAGVADAALLDGGPADAAAPDAGGDAGRGDAFVGELTGACGELDTELTSSMSFFFAAALDLPSDFDIETEAGRLSEGGQEILRDGTAGGSSVESEAFAYELLFRCDGALLLKTETEVLYSDPSGRKTDFLVSFDGTRVGVSVTRAVGFPREDPYPVSQATELLEDKLSDIAESSANVAEADRWVKQILLVVAYGPMHGESIGAAWEALDPSARGDTILYVMVTNGADDFLY